MRQVKIESSDGTAKAVFNVTPEAERVAKETRDRISAAVSSIRTQFGTNVKFNISQEAIEDLVAIHGPDVVKGMERDFQMDALMHAAFEGSQKAYDALFSMPDGRVLIDRMKIKNPKKDGKRK